MDFKEMGEALAKFARGELAPGKFSGMVMAYLESPDWRRRKAARESEMLKAGKAGRARLFELVEKAMADGWMVETQIVPLRGGGDSVLVQIEGGGTGFPYYDDPGLVEQGFAEILAHAAERRARRVAGQAEQ